MPLPLSPVSYSNLGYGSCGGAAVLLGWLLKWR